MSDNSAIEWTDHTFSPWWGCSRVSSACRSCYADAWASRWGHELWRRHGPRRMMSEAVWARPGKWNRDAERAGIPAKVFCASMADVFEDHPQVTEARKRLWGLIEATPWLRWQLLTKRIENVAGMVPWGNSWPSWVWLGTSVENQKWADIRIPVLLDIPAKVRFLSCEPLLSRVDLGFTEEWDECTCGTGPSGYYGMHERHCGLVPGPSWDRLHWIIAGGESGPRSRRTDPAWFRSLRSQCAVVGVPFFMKQAGAVLAREWGCSDRKGHIPAEWPEPFPREFPVADDLASAA
jgi:protein gp37